MTTDAAMVFDVLEDATRGFGVGDFETVSLVQRDDDLQGIHGICAQGSRGAKQRLIVADFLGSGPEA